MHDIRDFREETALNSAEELLLKTLAGTMGLSKSAVLRLALHQLGDQYMRKQVANDTGLFTED